MKAATLKAKVKIQTVGWVALLRSYALLFNGMEFYFFSPIYSLIIFGYDTGLVS